MSLLGLIIRIAIAALVLTGLTYFLKEKKEDLIEKHKNWFMTYLQHFCGALFIFSGYVKAVDPKGTAYKMKDYFAEFETHFSAFQGLWTTLAEHTLTFALVMIIFEIILGLMLIIGFKPKLTAWLFALLVIFFTVLTGFTYLTGYLPEGVTFFEFGKWGEYVKTNMKVTDCGCFGDFIKLEPKTSFFKDVFLLVPSILFIVFAAKEHILFNPRIRMIILGVATVLVSLFAFRNTFWNLPMQDFRPFKEGTHVRDVRAAEEKAVGEAKLSYKLKNKSTGEEIVMEMNDYLAKFSDQAFVDQWEILDQVREEVKTTKVSEFFVTDPNGSSVENDLLNYPNYHLMAVAYKWYFDEKQEQLVRPDTIWQIDTTEVEGFKDSVQIVKTVAEVKEVTYTATTYDWDETYANYYKNKVNPLFEAAEKEKILVYGITKPYDTAMIDEFRHHVQATYPFMTADDILLKTIVRSNPGVVLWKDGQIIKKWHISKLPDWEYVKANYIK